MGVRTNLCTNCSFPVDLTGWSLLAGSTSGSSWWDNSSHHTSPNAPSTTAIACLRINNSSASMANGRVYNLTLGAGTYTISTWAQILPSTTNAALIVKDHGSGAALGSEQHWTAPNNSWSRKSTTFTLAGSTSVDVIVGVGIGTGGTSLGSARFDEVLIEASSTLGDYFDGSFTDSTGATIYAWTGTAFASTSTASTGSPTPPPPPPTTGGWTLVEHNDFASAGAPDSSRFYVYDAFAGTNGDGTYSAANTTVTGGHLLLQPNGNSIAGFASQHRPLTYGKWDVSFYVTPIKGYKAVMFLWPDSEIWAQGEWDFCEMTDSTGATFQIFFHKPTNPTDNSKQTRVTHNITTPFTKVSIEKLPDRVTVLVNDIKVYEITAPPDGIWVGTTPCHLVGQIDVGMPDGANSVPTRANYPANPNPPFQLVIDTIDIYTPATVSSSSPLISSDSGSSSDSAVLQTTGVNLFENVDAGASSDVASLFVDPHVLAAAERGGMSSDTATLTVSGSAPTAVLAGMDRGASSDSASLFGSPQFLVTVDTGASADTATLDASADLSVAPVLGPVAQEIYDGLAPITGDDVDTGYALMRFVAALGSSADWTYDLARDTDAGVGWSSIVDLDRVPADALPWLAQFVGVDTIPELDDESQRLRIAGTAGFNRGSLAALQAAGQQYLTGGRSIIIKERDTSPYHLLVKTFAAETPSPGEVLQALLDEKPAGLVMEYEVVSGATYGALRATHLSYSALRASYPTYLYLKLAVLVSEGSIYGDLKATGLSYSALRGAYPTYLDLEGAQVATSPPVLDTTSGSSGNNVASVTWSHTVGSGSNRYLLVLVSNATTGTGTILPTGVTYNGVAMTQLVQEQSTNNPGRAATFYGLANPPSGAHNVVVSINGSSSNSLAVDAASFSNVDQVTPFSHATGAHVQPGTSVAIATASDEATDLQITGVAARNNSPMASSSQTVLGSIQSDSTFTYAALSSKEGLGGADSLSWSIASSDTMAAVAICLRGAV